MAARLTLPRWTAALLLVAAPAYAQQPAAQRPSPAAQPTQAAAPRPAPPQAFTALAGGWDLVSDDGRRKCRLTLQTAETPGGRRLGFQQSCRRNFPVLQRAAAWTVTPDGFVQINDARGVAAISFADHNEPFRVRGEAEGVAYQLDSLGRAKRFVERAAAPAPRAPINPQNAPPFETLPGLYGLLRAGDQEVCRINLTTQPAAGEGRYLANFPTRCRDRGLGVFDAVAWRYSGGRVFLIARRGHEIPMSADGPGRWRRDGTGGQDLWLRKAN